PRRELVIAIAEELALRLLSRSGLEHELEEPAADLGNRFLAVDDRAAVDVHVLFLVLEERGVRGELQRWRWLAAVRRAAARREADHVRATRDLAGRRNRVEAGRVH